MADQDIEYHKHVLKNGLTVLFIPMAGVRSATVLALANTGSRYEPEQWSGISHFLEHMVFKGTHSYPTAQDLAAAVDAVGAEFNAFTSKEYTGYYVKASSQHVKLAIDVVSDMVLTPTLRSEDLEREKGVIIEELNMYNDTPSRHIGNVFERLLFAKSSLGRDIIGTKETIRSLKREDFLKYMQQWYGLGNVVVTVAGDAQVLKSKQMMDWIEEAFQKPSDTKRKNGGERNLGKPFPFKNHPKIYIEHKKTDQAHFILGVPGIKRTDKDRYALLVLSVLFGGNMSSRLFTEVREKRGLCYYVRSDMDFYQDTGMFGAAAGVDPSRVEEAVRVVKEELFHLLDTSGSRVITMQEIQRAKDFLTGKTLLDTEDTESVANFYGGNQLLSGEVKTYSQLIKEISRVKLEDVQAVAKRLIKKDLVHFAMIGPFKTDAVFKKIIEE